MFLYKVLSNAEIKDQWNCWYSIGSRRFCVSLACLKTRRHRFYTWVYSGRAVFGLKGPAPSSALARIGVAFWEFCGVRFAACVFQFCEFSPRVYRGRAVLISFEIWVLGSAAEALVLKRDYKVIPARRSRLLEAGGGGFKGYRLCRRPLTRTRVGGFSIVF